jgi:hypothetical protein
MEGPSCYNLVNSTLKQVCGVRNVIKKLRGHHLVCLHFFQGRGYNEKFVRNLHEVLTSVKNEGTLFIPGADDVCNACPHLLFAVCRDEEEIGEMDEEAALLLQLEEGQRYDWEQLEERVRSIFPVWYKNYCRNCGWIEACERSDTYRSLKRLERVNPGREE